MYKLTPCSRRQNQFLLVEYVSISLSHLKFTWRSILFLAPILHLFVHVPPSQYVVPFHYSTATWWTHCGALSRTRWCAPQSLINWYLVLQLWLVLNLKTWRLHSNCWWWRWWRRWRRWWRRWWWRRWRWWRWWWWWWWWWWIWRRIKNFEPSNNGNLVLHHCRHSRLIVSRTLVGVLTWYLSLHRCPIGLHLIPVLRHLLLLSSYGWDAVPWRNCLLLGCCEWLCHCWILLHSVWILSHLLILSHGLLILPDVLRSPKAHVLRNGSSGSGLRGGFY